MLNYKNNIKQYLKIFSNIKFMKIMLERFLHVKFTKIILEKIS